MSREGDVFTGVCPFTPGGGGGTYSGRGGTYLGEVQMGGGTYPGRGGYLPWPGGVTYLGPGSIGSTFYVAGGMPHAFTQEDCLVFNAFRLFFDLFRLSFFTFVSKSKFYLFVHTGCT